MKALRRIPPDAARTDFEGALLVHEAADRITARRTTSSVRRLEEIGVRPHRRINRQG